MCSGGGGGGGGTLGPVLPILPFSDLDECITACNEIDVNPLALYVFSSDKADQEKCLNSIQSGDAIINDCTSSGAFPCP